LLGSDSETNRTRAISPSPSTPALQADERRPTGSCRLL
jgi:hypothetical protein